MITCRPLDVVVGLFPFIDVLARKPRPILVISSSAFLEGHDHLIGAMITTGRDSAWPSDISIDDFAAAGLRHPSVIRMKLFTLPRSTIATRIGALSNDDARKFRTGFNQIVV